MSDPQPHSAAHRWLSTVPALVLLSWTVVHWAATTASGRMISVGEELWPGYAISLRTDQPRPEPPADSAPGGGTDGGTDDALIGDLLGDDDDAGQAAEGSADDALIDDLLGEEGAEGGAAEESPDDALIDDLLEDEPDGEPSDGDADDALIDDLLDDEPDSEPSDAEGDADDALIDDLLGDEPAAEPRAAEPDGPTPQQTYAAELAAWEESQARLTPTVRAWRTADAAFSTVSAWGSAHIKHLLVLLLLLCGATTTAGRHHISLRPISTRLDDRVSQGMQLLANGLVFSSLIALHRANEASGVDLDNPELPLMWAAAFGVMGAINVVHLVRGAPHLKDGGAWFQASLTPPLYAGMAVVSSVWFLGLEGYPAGLAVYLGKLTEHAELYIFVGLYVWAGMLLKRTRVAHLGFDVLRPWKLPPELLAALVVLLAAIPTAYSGASGIFVIAVGALIFRELSEAGARPQLALAATAMSGSLGVVLRPCLLVVIVAYLNPPTTDTLYGWGRWVFLLSAGLFALAVILTRQGPLRAEAPKVAMPGSLRALPRLLPYVLVGAATLGACDLLLDVRLDEHTAPVLLPVALMGMLLVERLRRGADARSAEPALAPSGEPEPAGVLDATDETTGHIGALVLLMSLSIALGGVFERAEVMALVPQDLGSTWATMALMVAVLVVIGMLMDPYGAVILVSATLAEVAYRNGIDEAHFWMVVLVAFELGYLTPPVALNHLLTRQVVGAETVDAALAADRAPGQSLWRRHERYLLPIAVMATALLLVAFGPLVFGVGGAE